MGVAEAEGVRFIPDHYDKQLIDLKYKWVVGEREEGGPWKSRGWQLPQHYGYMYVCCM